ncbi:MAG: hypothetical protein ACJ75J_03050 [Cytophagaceae bacterium]
MKKLILLISCLCFAQVLVYGENALTLWDAVQARQITVTARWNTNNRVYGHNLIMNVVNNQKQKITVIIYPGETFLCHSQEHQNQMVVRADTIIIPPKDSLSVYLYSVCIGHEKQSPGVGDEFSLIAQKDVILKDMATYISDYGFFNTSTAQAAVWTIQGRSPISSIYSADSVMAWGLATRAAELTNQPVPENILLREHHIVVLNGNFNYQAVRPITVSLGVYDTTGKVVNLLMNKKPLPAGYHTFIYHANEVAPEGTKYLLKMTNDKGEALYSKVLTEDAENMETFNQRIICPFILDKSYKDLNLGIYDAKGNLMTEIFGYKPWIPGTYNINYTLFHNRKNDSVFYLQLRGKDNNVVMQKAIRKKKQEDDKYPEETLEIQLKYPVSVKTEKTKCIIYNEFGEEAATVFENKKLNPGPNEINYKLKHTYGKKARFIIQVAGPTGQILFSKELIQP